MSTRLTVAVELEAHCCSGVDLYSVSIWCDQRGKDQGREEPKQPRQRCLLWISPSKIYHDQEYSRALPGGPVVKTSPSNAGEVCSIPDQGAEIPHTSGPKSQNRGNTLTSGIKTLKMARIKKQTIYLFLYSQLKIKKLKNYIEITSTLVFKQVTLPLCSLVSSFNASE